MYSEYCKELMGGLVNLRAFLVLRRRSLRKLEDSDLKVKVLSRNIKSIDYVLDLLIEGEDY